MLSGIAYLLAISKKPVGLSIPFCGDSVDSVWYRVVTFYPASGYRQPTSGAFAATDSGGYAWHSTVTAASACCMGFHSSVAHPAGGANRAFGYPVRCVQYLLLFL
jgi:hypothetical protein